MESHALSEAESHRRSAPEVPVTFKYTEPGTDVSNAIAKCVPLIVGLKFPDKLPV